MAQTFEWPSYTQTVHRASYPAIDPTNPANSAAGKVVVVTGAGTGIGKGIAEAFIHAGAKAVAILGRRGDVLATAKASLDQIASSSSKKAKTQILTFQADILDATALNAAFAATAQQFGPIDVAIANAGYLPSPSPAAGATDIADWFHAFEVNIKGTLLTYQAFAAHKRAASSDATEQPIFIAVNTAASTLVLPGYSSYAASKLAQQALVSYLADENPDVRVVQYHPGVLATDMLTKSHMQLSTDDMSLPSSYAVWLASPAARWTHGLFLWAHWDVDELAALKDEIVSGKHLRLALNGFPRVEKPTVV